MDTLVLEWLRQQYGEDWLLEGERQGARGYCYFLQCVDTGIIKIGMSRWVEALEGRIQAQQKERPFGIRVLKIIHGGFATEDSLHDRFRADRCFDVPYGDGYTEWFHPSADLLTTIDRLENAPDLPEDLFRDRLTPEQIEQRRADREEQRQREPDPQYRQDRMLKFVMEPPNLDRPLEEVLAELKGRGWWP